MKFTQYKSIGEIFSRYWTVYGGTKALIKSPYLHASLIFSFLIPCWKDKDWVNIPISIIPSVLGFSLAGYAMFLTFGNDQFRKFIATGYGEKNAPFMTFSAMFMNFICVQVVALFFAVFCIAWGIYNNFLAWLGFVAFIYALLSGLASALETFRLSDMFKKWLEEEDN